MQSRPGLKIIGVTGGFGTGKTFVAAIFKKLGARVIDADRLSRRAVKRGTVCYDRIVRAFGPGILTKTGSIDRKRLAGMVFNSKRKLSRLNRIVHPFVIKSIKKNAAGSRNGVVVLDAPLLIEAKLTAFVDKVVVVKCSKPVQLKRTMKKFGMEEYEVTSRINSQLPIIEKEKMADFVINNNGKKEETEKQVIKIWRRIHGNS